MGDGRGKVRCRPFKNLDLDILSHAILVEVRATAGAGGLMKDGLLLDGVDAIASVVRRKLRYRDFVSDFVFCSGKWFPETDMMSRGSYG